MNNKKYSFKNYAFDALRFGMEIFGIILITLSFRGVLYSLPIGITFYLLGRLIGEDFK